VPLLHHVSQLMGEQPPARFARRLVLSCSKCQVGADCVRPAFTARAASAAFPSVCTRTWLKSCPKRGSMKARVASFSGWPDERSTSCTIGGVSFPGVAVTAARCNAHSRLRRAQAHSSPAPARLPEAHALLSVAERRPHGWRRLPRQIGFPQSHRLVLSSVPPTI
jgi:hypothetical protein